MYLLEACGSFVLDVVERYGNHRKGDSRSFLVALLKEELTTSLGQPSEASCNPCEWSTKFWWLKLSYLESWRKCGVNIISLKRSFVKRWHLMWIFLLVSPFSELVLFSPFVISVLDISCEQFASHWEGVFFPSLLLITSCLVNTWA